MDGQKTATGDPGGVDRPREAPFGWLGAAWERSKGDSVPEGSGAFGTLPKWVGFQGKGGTEASGWVSFLVSPKKPYPKWLNTAGFSSTT